MKVFTRIATILAVVIAVWLIVRVTSYCARLPESNCVTTPASEYLAPDRAYKATVLEKDCNMGEDLFLFGSDRCLLAATLRGLVHSRL